MKTKSRKPSKNDPINLLDPRFKYVPAAATDVTKTWRKFGWKPIERKEKMYEGGT
jgi:hypothetical protein